MQRQADDDAAAFMAGAQIPGANVGPDVRMSYQQPPQEAPKDMKYVSNREKAALRHNSSGVNRSLDVSDIVGSVKKDRFGHKLYNDPTQAGVYAGGRKGHFSVDQNGNF